jgi:hypothetical protein
VKDPILEEYHRRIDAMTPAERVARSGAMFRWARQLIARQIVRECGPLPEEVLKWRVARKFYEREPPVVALIDKMLADVSS